MADISRRGLITGLASLLAAPAIVRASSLMPVRAAPTTYGCSPIQSTIADLRYIQEYIRAYEKRCAIVADVNATTGIDLRPGALNIARGLVKPLYLPESNSGKNAPLIAGI